MGVEAAALRRGIKGLCRQAQDAHRPSPTAPGYSVALGVIAKELKAVTGRLDAVERTPTLAVTPGQQAGELRRELFQIGQHARGGLAQSQAQLDVTVRELGRMIRSAREWRDQQ